MNKMALLLAFFFLFWTMLLGHFNLGLRTLKNTYMRAMGKQTYICALASPIVITLIYLGQDYALYLTNPSSTIFGAGHVLCNVMTSFLLYIFIEYPLKTVVGYLTPFVSHTELLKKHYMKEIIASNDALLNNTNVSDTRSSRPVSRDFQFLQNNLGRNAKEQ